MVISSVAKDSTAHDIWHEIPWVSCPLPFLYIRKLHLSLLQHLIELLTPWKQFSLPLFVMLQAIVDDYVLSETVLKESRMHHELHLDAYLTADDVIAATRDTMDDTIEYIKHRYTDARGYMSDVSLLALEMTLLSAASGPLQLPYNPLPHQKGTCGNRVCSEESLRLKACRAIYQKKNSFLVLYG